MLKKFFIILSTLCIFTSTFSFAQKHMKIGFLSMLNASEEEAAKLMQARAFAASRITASEDERSVQKRLVEASLNDGVIFYDNLSTMLMALQSSEITFIATNRSMADYICAWNPDLLILDTLESVKEDSDYVKEILQNGLFMNDFSFMMMEKNTKLRDDFNEVIDEMKKDGTLERLVDEHITKSIEGKIASLKLPRFKGADTIKVAVTGDLPPMDYVSPRGVPAGFNTAVLSEISRRLGKNIRLISTDSGSRSTALASGLVDVVFWTRGSDLGKEMEEYEFEEVLERHEVALTQDEEKTFDRQLRDMFDFSSYGKMDIPEGTITTNSYYSDRTVLVLQDR